MFFYIWTGPINDFLSWTGWSPIAKVYMATKIHCNDNDANVDSTINMEVMDIMVVLAMTIFVDKVKMVLLMLITSNSNCF